jgi:hypothetical protein
MEITGKIYKINETQVVSDRFSKREFVLTTEANTPYPQSVKFEFTQDKTTVLDSYNLGDEVSVSFNIRGRLHNGNNGEQCYVTLQAWRIEKVGETFSGNHAEIDMKF